MAALEGEKLVEAVVAVGGVLVFVAIAMYAGAGYSGEGLTETGALTLVGGIVVFILLMAGIGYWLAGR
ncbi:MAG: hypothetical protein ABEJ42_09670 [Halobacteriaceae archaeon]